MTLDSTEVPTTATRIAAKPRLIGASALLPVQIPHTRHMFARGIQAGRWVFATGQCGTDYSHALAPEVLQSAHPHNGGSKARREAKRIFQNVNEVLVEAGASAESVVRIDQYYTSPEVVDAYHEVRREYFKGVIPPSTSNLHRRFSRVGQSMEVQVMAAIGDEGFSVQHEKFSGTYRIHPSSGYSPALRAGDFRFIPGQTAEALREEDAPVDPEAKRPYGLWKGTPIKLETEFIIRRKLAPALEKSNSSLDNVVKAQVYLRDEADIAGFNEVWSRHFKTPPATTIVATATPGFIMPELRIEINVIALANDGDTRKESITAAEPLFEGWTPAIRAGDLLFISGLMGVCNGRLVGDAISDPTQPFFGFPVKAELQEILRQADILCRAAGTTVQNVVRIQQFHRDLATLAPTLDTWSDALYGQPIPISPVEVNWLPVPDAQIQVDLWVYVPG